MRKTLLSRTGTAAPLFVSIPADSDFTNEHVTARCSYLVCEKSIAESNSVRVVAHQTHPGFPTESSVGLYWLNDRKS